MYLFKFLPVLTLFVYTGYVGHSIVQPKQLPGQASPSLTSKQQQLESICLAELGVREHTGKNDGSRVEEYLRYTGLAKGQPWCASFVCWCLAKAGIPNPRSAWCPSLFQQGKIIYSSSDINKPAARLQSGDVFGLWFPDKKRIAHVGFISSFRGKWVQTIEGNTNLAGSREGDGVYAKRRLFSTLYKVARYVPDE